jgi:hypothetical protein
MVPALTRMHSTRPIVLGVVAVAALVAVAGCGPIRYASQVTTRASNEVEAAERLDARKAAPYEATIAREYLHKAREEAGESRWERALDYGQKAEAFGKAAQVKAGGSTVTASPVAGDSRDDGDGTRP